jgi:dTDP-4-amino-4,6-dideoxygalactose transaminase
MGLSERKISFSVPYLSGREIDYLSEVLRTRQFAGNGPFTQKAQALIEGKFGVPKVLLTHSCTAALEMSALLLGIGPGDEVIMPSYTFCSTASAFARTGAKIVFCDIDSATMMVDPDDMAARITPRTRALVPIHYGGLSCDIDRIALLARDKGVTLVEDAAQGFDARWNDRPLGTFGRMGCISFHETKNIHAGLCGALYLNDEDAEFHDRAIRVWERGTNRQFLSDRTAGGIPAGPIGSHGTEQVGAAGLAPVL